MVVLFVNHVVIQNVKTMEQLKIVKLECLNYNCNKFGEVIEKSTTNENYHFCSKCAKPLYKSNKGPIIKITGSVSTGRN